MKKIINEGLYLVSSFGIIYTIFTVFNRNVLMTFGLMILFLTIKEITETSIFKYGEFEKKKAIKNFNKINNLVLEVSNINNDFKNIAEENDTRVELIFDIINDIEINLNKIENTLNNKYYMFIPFISYIFRLYNLRILKDINKMEKLKNTIIKSINICKEKNKREGTTTNYFGSGYQTAFKLLNINLNDLKGMSNKEFRKKIYLPMVKKFHPDNGGKKETFQELSNCIEVIQMALQQGISIK